MHFTLILFPHYRTVSLTYIFKTEFELHFRNYSSSFMNYSYLASLMPPGLLGKGFHNTINKNKTGLVWFAKINSVKMKQKLTI